MSFTLLYRTSFYLMLFFATLTLSVDVPESPYAMLFPAAIAVASVIALLTVDCNPRLGLNRSLSNWLALFSVGLVLLEFSNHYELLLISLAHWLVYLQLIKIFLPKRVEDDWFLFLLGLMQVLVGADNSQSDRVGEALAIWAFLALWVLTLFSLHRDAIRYLPRTGPATDYVPIMEDPYPGLLDPAFVFAALRVTLMTLALGSVIFLALPRRSSLARLHGATIAPRHLTGFDEEVKLGQLGEILEDDSVVMSIELFDAESKRIGPPVEPLWRGVTMASYNNGRWSRQRWSSRVGLSDARNLEQLRPVIVQRIRLEASDSPVLFGLRPIYKATSGQSPTPEFVENDGTLARRDPRSETYDYTVVSDADPVQPQARERLPRREGSVMGLLLEVPLSIREEMTRIAEQQVRNIPEDQPLLRAQALEQYLLNSGNFRYSLHQTVMDSQIDPVLDFLVNTRTGHCAYFASALTLLLRSVGLPARMVNGFKGGDWNEFAQVLNVRQKHAHSWVEVLVPPAPGKDHDWVTLDPTPATERNEAVASVGGFAANFRQFTDLVRYVWVFYVVGYNSDRQRFLVYEPIRLLAESAQDGFRMMGQASRSAMKAVFGFHDFEAFISIRGFFVSFFVLLTLVGLGRLGFWLWWQAVRYFRGDVEDSASLSASQLFYRRLTQLLSRFGLDRPAAETQHEFAHRASAFLTGRGSGTAGVADVPPLVVAAYYSVRFGQRELSPKALEQIERRLDALEASLNANAE
jgi:transglutaminase-like putative cysteine protease